MKKIILASNNAKKIKELKNMLEEYDFEICSLKDENIEIDVLEDGNTFEENAVKKASEIYSYLLDNNKGDVLVLADDSGLEVDYLNGEPGIYSARYSGEHGNDYANNMKLLDKMKLAKGEDRRGRFVCALALIGNDTKHVIRGTVEGYIKEELIEGDFFGYDPLFFYPEFNKTFAEASAEEKNSISHRGNALAQLKKVLMQL
ncbi:MAG: RdgB/HAM1 family non-canonical purine NTP pyrophosphatase [Clostridium sp.]|nr:RdgB/HAM1 family non-canonical purine NTP pyrophosphatase [Clostridium sp.]